MNKKMNISMDVFIYSVLLIPFLGVGYFNQFETIINIFKIISVGFFTLFVLKDYKKIKFNNISALILLFALYELFMTIFHSTLSLGLLFSIYYYVIILFFVQQQLSNHRYSFFHALCIVHSVIILLNVPSLLSQLSVSTYNRVYFLGGKNSIIMFSLPTIFYTYLSAYLKNSKLTFFNKVVLFISVVSPLLCSSTTGFIVASFVVLFMAFNNLFNINFKYLYILYIIMLFIVLNIQKFGEISIINELVLNKMHKDLTFTGRTKIWDLSISLIKRNLFGYGRENKILAYSFNGINECHNIFIQLLFDGGVPALLMFLYYFIACHKSIDHINSPKISKMITFTKIVVFAFMFLGLTESMSYSINLWLILIVLYFANRNKIEIKEDVINE